MSNSAIPLGPYWPPTHAVAAIEPASESSDNMSCAAATEPASERSDIPREHEKESGFITRGQNLTENFTERDNPTGNSSGHFITRFINSTCPPESRWALLTQSMSILGGGYGSESLTESIDTDLNASSVLDLDSITHGNFLPRGSPHCSDEHVNGRDYFPDTERARKHYSTDPGVCVCHI
jgi:hypothetical protein